MSPARRERRAPERRVRVIPVYRNLNPVAANKAIEDRSMVRFATACRTTDALPTSGQTPTKAE